MIVAQPTQEAFAPIINVESFILWMALVSLRAVIVLASISHSTGRAKSKELGKARRSSSHRRPAAAQRHGRTTSRGVFVCSADQSPEARLEPMRHGGDAEFFERPAQRLVGDLNGTGAAWRESPIWSSRATGR